jgi:flagellar hook assembly protein FlgD
LDLYNQAGELVRVIAAGVPVQGLLSDFTVTDPTFSPQAGQQAVILVNGVTYLWNGSNNGGQVVSSGIYYLKLSSTDNTGNQTVYMHDVTVLDSGKQFSLKIYNSAGELVRTLALGSYTGAAPDQLTVDRNVAAFGPNGGLFNFNLGPASAAWNGLNDAGQSVQAGDYTVQLVTENQGAASIIDNLTVTVLKVGGNVLAGAIVGPNPVPEGVQQVSVKLPNAPSGSIVVGRLYNVSGELIMTVTNNQQAGRLTFNLGQHRVSAGIYLLSLSANTPWGQAQRSLLHFVVVH